MSILLEAITAVVSFGAGALAWFPFFSKRAMAFGNEDCPFGSIPWNRQWIQINDIYPGFFAHPCPKCNCSRDNQKIAPYCEEPHFPRGHFHFECQHCHFQAIMRTKDDKG